MSHDALGVACAGARTATVGVTLPDGRKRRVLFFEGGKPLGTDWGQAAGNANLRATRRGNLSMRQAGNERDETLGAVVNDGQGGDWLPLPSHAAP